MNCRLYMHTARCINDPARASKFLKEALMDLEKYANIISEVPDIRFSNGIKLNCLKAQILASELCRLVASCESNFNTNKTKTGAYSMPTY